MVVRRMPGGFLNPILAWFEELKTCDSRVSIILATSRLDDALIRLLKAKMHNHPGGGRDDLFDTDKAFGTFSSRILLAYRLGIIDREFESFLQATRKLRNEAAHAQDQIDLAKSPHIDRIMTMSSVASKSGLWKAGSPINPKTDAVSSLLGSLLLAVTLLEFALLHAEPFEPMNINFSRQQIVDE